MKYIIILGDGMADEPLDILNGKTPLESANKKYMDALAAESEQGLTCMVPEGMSPGSDTANLSVCGYDPKIYYSGRSPLEALSIGVELKDTDIAIRCNLVTVSEDDKPYNEKTIIDHSSGEISTEDAAILLDAVKEGLKREGYDFYVGTSYRHLLVWDKGQVVDLVPPHDILTKCIGTYLPQDAVLREMMEKSYDILVNHPINMARKEAGLNPANSVWFWGAGTKPALTSFEEKTGMKGMMISAVDLLKGIAIGAGMSVAEVEGANGGLHTNYEGKARAALSALLKDGYDFVYVHVEAPDEMGHQGLVKEKIQAIEFIDEKIVGVIAEEMDRAGEDYRMLILPDHPTPICKRTHTPEPVPYLLFDSRKEEEGLDTYCEKNAAKTGNVWINGHQLLEHLLEK